jgi:alpha-N-arabinofuranosidase
MSRTPLAALLLLSACWLTSCRTDDRRQADRVIVGPYVQFDWFEYSGSQPGGTAASTGQYENPILAGFHPDPSIVRANDAYYLVVSSFAYWPGIPVFESRDLVNWTQIGHVLDRPGQIHFDSIGISRGIFAPTIRYHEGLFYLVTTAVDVGGNMVLTATDPAGPWSDPVWLPDVDGIDPSIFFDDDGRTYVTNNGPPDYPPRYDGHRAIWIQEFDPAELRTFGPRKVIVDGGVDIESNPIWIEAPHIFKVDGLYYLIAAEGGTGDQHSEVVFRSSSAMGAYEPYSGNPILTQRHLDPDRPDPITSTGHADFTQTPDGDWWAVFLGCRPYSDDLYNTGRETFLMPVRWVDGWPVITEGEEVVPSVLDRPDLPSRDAPPIPHRGDFAVRDDFDRPDLAPYWNFIRSPSESWYSLTARPGQLSVRGRSEPLHELGQPSFIGRRQQHNSVVATTSMVYQPREGSDHAGLVAFQNRDSFYLMSVRQIGNQHIIKLESRAGGTSSVVAALPLGDARSPVRILLRIEAEGPAYRFLYKQEERDAQQGDRDDGWQILADSVDGTILSTARAGGFVGTYLGLFAYASEP